MANKYQGEVSIRLDRVRKLKFGFNAYADFEEAMGRSLISMVDGKTPAEINQALSGVRVVRALLWAGLRDEDPALTLDKAGRLVEFAEGDDSATKIQYVTGKVMQAFEMGAGEQKKSTETEANGTGTRSSE